MPQVQLFSQERSSELGSSMVCLSGWELIALGWKQKAIERLSSLGWE